ncbi:hypothetical protein QZH41_003014 [Actinostola sp. cb2023]|nr:hypothetical protein QZH41_003014 [Actinostola sp. cb2023]
MGFKVAANQIVQVESQMVVVANRMVRGTSRMVRGTGRMVEGTSRKVEETRRVVVVANRTVVEASQTLEEANQIVAETSRLAEVPNRIVEGGQQPPSNAGQGGQPSSSGNQTKTTLAPVTTPTTITTTPGESTTVPTPSSKTTCKSKIDLVFLIDGSASIEMYGTGTFQSCLNFIKTVINAFDVSRDGTRVGAISFSTNSTLDFDFDKYNDKQDLDSAIDKIDNAGLTTFTGKGLKFALEKVFNSARNGVPKVLVLMTDGRSNDDVIKPSQLLKNSGVQIVTLGLGTNYDIDQLKAIATKPVTGHVITVDFPQLTDATTTLQDYICKALRQATAITTDNISDRRTTTYPTEERQHLRQKNDNISDIRTTTSPTEER